MYRCVLNSSALHPEPDFSLIAMIVNHHCRCWSSVIFGLLAHFCRLLSLLHLTVFYIYALHLSFSASFLFFCLLLIFTDIISLASALYHFSLWSSSLSVTVLFSHQLHWLYCVNCKLTAVCCYNLWWVSLRFKMCILVKQTASQTMNLNLRLISMCLTSTC